MAVYRVYYTIVTEVEAEDEDDAYNKSGDVDLNLLEADVEIEKISETDW